MALYVAKVDAERRETERKLKRSEELLNNTGEIARVGGWEVNLDKNTVYWSAVTKILHEVPPDYEPTINEAISFFPSESRRQISDAVKNAIEKGESYTLELDFVTANKNRLRIRTIGHSEFEKGRCARLYGTFQDITEQKRQEKDLVFRSMVLDQINDNVTVTDMKGIITYVNKAVERTLRNPRTEIIGSPTTIYGEDSEKGATQNEIIEKTLKESAYRCEIVNFDTDNNEHIMDCRSQVVTDEKGDPIALCGIATDVTEQKRLEEELKKEHQRFKDLTELLPDVIFELDMQLKLSYANEKAFETFGYSKEEFEKGISVSQIIAPESQEKASKNIHRLLSGEKIGLKEYVAMAKDGSKFPVLIHSNQILQNGSVIGLRGILLDISERKETEEKIRFQSRILDCIDQAIIVTDMRGNILFYNSQAEKYYMWTSEDVSEKNVMEIMNLSEQQGKDLSEALSKRQKLRDDYEMIRKDGTKVTVKINFTPFIDETGDMQAIVGISESIPMPV